MKGKSNKEEKSQNKAGNVNLPVLYPLELGEKLHQWMSQKVLLIAVNNFNVFVKMIELVSSIDIEWHQVKDHLGLARCYHDI